MTVQCTVPILRPVACKLCKMWQILHDRAIKIVADFSILFECHPFTLRNIANDKKRRYIKKDFWRGIRMVKFLIASLLVSYIPSNTLKAD